MNSYTNPALTPMPRRDSTHDHFVHGLADQPRHVRAALQTFKRGGILLIDDEAERARLIQDGEVVMKITYTQAAQIHDVLHRDYEEHFDEVQDGAFAADVPVTAAESALDEPDSDKSESGEAEWLTNTEVIAKYPILGQVWDKPKISLGWARKRGEITTEDRGSSYVIADDDKLAAYVQAAGGEPVEAKPVERAPAEDVSEDTSDEVQLSELRTQPESKQDLFEWGREAARERDDLKQENAELRAALSDARSEILERRTDALLNAHHSFGEVPAAMNRLRILHHELIDAQHAGGDGAEEEARLREHLDHVEALYQRIEDVISRVHTALTPIHTSRVHSRLSQITGAMDFRSLYGDPPHHAAHNAAHNAVDDAARGDGGPARETESEAQETVN